MLIKEVELESRLFKGFADQSRLAILASIFESPKTVSEIVKATKLSQPNTSAHLACLLDCTLVKKKKVGREAIYSISGEEVKNIIIEARKIIKKRGENITKCINY